MNRRALLRGIGGGVVALSGCLGARTDEPFVTDRSVTVSDRGCAGRQNAGTLDYDESDGRLHVDGLLAGTTNCGDLDVAYAYNESSSRVIVEVLPADDAQCPSCTRYYDYEATVSFRETPSVVVVVHSDPEVLDAVGTVVRDDSKAGTEP